MTNPSVTTDRVLTEVLAERIRQDDRWGEQNHPDGTGPRVPAIVGALCWADEAADRARLACQSAARKGETTWRLVFAEEVLEALAEADPTALRAELVQVAAVAVAWIEAIDRRTAAQPAAEPVEACAKCKTPFEPRDLAFDGHARYRQTPFCRRCIDACHESTDAFHRCAVCR